MKITDSRSSIHDPSASAAIVACGTFGLSANRKSSRRLICGTRAASENRDGATVDRARGQRAADGELHPGGAVLAAEQHDVDHLPGSIRAPVALDQPGPQPVEAVRPLATIALLAERNGVLQPARLALQQLEVVIELDAGPELAVQPLMPRDLPPAMVDRDLP